MDAPHYSGPDERELDADYQCDQCGCDLYPSEHGSGRCSRCVQDALEANREDEGDAA